MADDSLKALEANEEYRAINLNNYKLNFEEKNALMSNHKFRSFLIWIGVTSVFVFEFVSKNKGRNLNIVKAGAFVFGCFLSQLNNTNFKSAAREVDVKYPVPTKQQIMFARLNEENPKNSI
jgi:hypothetical protein